MQNKLKEFIPLSDEEKKLIWNNGVFVLDANALLNMCRYTKQSCDELMAIIKNHKDNLWLPYQVAMEFFNNRISVIEGIRNGFISLLTNVSKIDEILEKELKLNDFKNDTALNVDKIRNDIKNFKSRTSNKIKKWMTEFEKNDKDSLLEEILELYEGKVGDDYDDNDLDKIYDEGGVRYPKSIPPGYADMKEKEKMGNRHKFGDLIWWKQAIDYAKTMQKDLIIVTDDRKEDWWYKVSGRIISPRVELIREFHKETDGRKFLMYQTHQFMKMAKELDDAQVSDSSISEAEEKSFIDYSQLMTMYGIGANPLDYTSLYPNTILENLHNNYPMGYNPYGLGQIDGKVLGRDYNDFYKNYPEGFMPFPKIDNDGFVERVMNSIINKDKK